MAAIIGMSAKSSMARAHASPKSAVNAAKPLGATPLAEPFPGAMAQGLVLGFAKEFDGL
jgi:hypothetical protein